MRLSVNPVDFDDGYLVATDAIHLGVSESADAFRSSYSLFGYARM